MPMSASRQIHTCVSPISISTTGAAGSAFGARVAARTAVTAFSAIAGTNGGAPAASALRRASLRQVNSCCGVAPCRDVRDDRVRSQRLFDCQRLLPFRPPAPTTSASDHLDAP